MCWIAVPQLALRPAARVAAVPVSSNPMNPWSNKVGVNSSPFSIPTARATLSSWSHPRCRIERAFEAPQPRAEPGCGLSGRTDIQSQKHLSPICLNETTPTAKHVGQWFGRR